MQMTPLEQKLDRLYPKLGTDDYIGKRFGRLVILYRVPPKNPNDNHKMYYCRCDCGREIIVRGTCLRGGQKDCGCSNRKALSLRLKKHGMFGTRIYGIWNGILGRTKYKYPRDKNNYWGRGITICKDWENFENFYLWAINNGYKDNLSIDRIDVNGNYAPDNCQWVTSTQQANNRRNTRWITYKGVTRSITEWCRELKLNEFTIKSRYRRGITPPEIFEKPIIKHGKKKN